VGLHAFILKIGFAILRSELARLLEKKATLKILLKKMDKEREKRRKVTI